MQETYVNEDEPWMVILEDEASIIFSTHSILKDYTTVQLVFDHGMIILIKQNKDWELIYK